MRRKKSEYPESDNIEDKKPLPDGISDPKKVIYTVGNSEVVINGSKRWMKTSGKVGRPSYVNFAIDLFESQKKIYEACFSTRFVFVQAGRRFGKTTVSKRVLLDKCLEKPNKVIWYVAPTQKDAKELVGIYFDNLPASLFKSRKGYYGYYEFKNGSILWIKGSERMDNLRGRGLDYVVMEEFSFHKKGVWEEVIRPQLADKGGGALFIGTPSVKQGVQYRQLSEYAKNGKDKEWVFFHFTIYDNPNIKKEEIDNIKNSTMDYVFKQEYMAEFVENEGFVYYEFNRSKHIYNEDVRFSEAINFPCYEGIDWGLSDYTACVWVHQLKDGKFIVTDEYMKKNLPPKKQAENILKVRGSRNVSFSVMDYLSLNKRDNDSIESIKVEFKNSGFSNLYPSIFPTPEVKNDSIILMKKLLVGINGEPLLYINKKCINLINAIENYIYGEHEPDVLSALRYVIYFVYRKNNALRDHNINLSEIKLNNQVKSNTFTYNKLTRKNYTNLQWDFEYGIPEE